MTTPTPTDSPHSQPVTVVHHCGVTRHDSFRDAMVRDVPRDDRPVVRLDARHDRLPDSKTAQNQQTEETPFDALATALDAPG